MQEAVHVERGRDPVPGRKRGGAWQGQVEEDPGAGCQRVPESFTGKLPPYNAIRSSWCRLVCQNKLGCIFATFLLECIIITFQLERRVFLFGGLGGGGRGVNAN